MPKYVISLHALLPDHLQQLRPELPQAALHGPRMKRHPGGVKPGPNVDPRIPGEREGAEAERPVGQRLAAHLHLAEIGVGPKRRRIERLGRTTTVDLLGRQLGPSERLHLFQIELPGQQSEKVPSKLPVELSVVRLTNVHPAQVRPHPHVRPRLVGGHWGWLCGGGV